MKTIVLFNPKANNGQGEAEAQKVSDLLKDKELDFTDITQISSYEEFFKSLNSGDEIVICGGDGTLNHFVNDTYVFRIENDVYYYPTGSGNDFYHDVKGATIKSR